MNILSCFFIAFVTVATLENGIERLPQIYWTTDEHLRTAVINYGCHPVRAALKKSERIWKLGRATGLSKAEIFRLALFIETELPSKIKKGHTYFRKEQTGLARTVEYDPKTANVFIHLKTHGVEPLGRGRYKRVTRSIKYAPGKPELIANCILRVSGSERSSDSLEHEVNAIERTHGSKGIPRTYAITSHTKKSSPTKVISFLQKLYRSGSLKKYILANGQPSYYEMLLLTRDYAQGIEALHAQNLVHGDLHPGNLMVDKRDNKLSGIIIDFGHAMDAKKAAKKAPKVQTTRRRNPPEVYGEDKEGVDAKAVDLYALGMIFYQLYFGKEPEWSAKRNFPKEDNRTPEENVLFQKKLTEAIQKWLEIRRIEARDRPFATLILDMCEPDPTKRHSAKEIRQKLDDLINSSY